MWGVMLAVWYGVHVRREGATLPRREKNFRQGNSKSKPLSQEVLVEHEELPRGRCGQGVRRGGQEEHTGPDARRWWEVREVFP